MHTNSHTNMCKELVEVRTSLQLKICSHGRNQSEQPGILIQDVSVMFQSSVVMAERGWRRELISQHYIACTSQSRHSSTPRIKISNPFTWFWDSPVPAFDPFSSAPNSTCVNSQTSLAKWHADTLSFASTGKKDDWLWKFVPLCGKLTLQLLAGESKTAAKLI